MIIKNGALAPEGIFAAKKEINQKFTKATEPQLARAVGAELISPPLQRGPQETIFVSWGGKGGEGTPRRSPESRRDGASGAPAEPRDLPMD